MSLRDEEVKPFSDEKDEEPPPRLYRYRGVRGPQSQYTRDIIINAQHYLSSPSFFNDPFDHSPIATIPETSLKRQSELRKARARARLKYGRDYANEIYRDCSKMTAKQMQQMAIAVFRSWRDDSGVICYSELGDDLLMWGHYGDCHRGICLEFSAPNIEADRLALRVKYSQERPKLPALDFRGNVAAFITAITTKADCWAYEREWREISSEAKGKYLRFDPSELVGITFGASISPEDEALVRGWVAQSKSRPKFSRAQLSPLKYRIEIIDL